MFIFFQNLTSSHLSSGLTPCVSVANTSSGVHVNIGQSPFKHIEAVSKLTGVQFAPDKPDSGMTGGDAKQVQTLSVLKEGSKVEGNCRGKGKWYPGRVKKDRGEKNYLC
jgi:hypothetical protein